MSHGSDIVLIGHPFAPIGCGESLRCSYRAFRSVALAPRLLDVYGHFKPEHDAEREFGPALTDTLGRINVFHLNADEVDNALSLLKLPADSYNILYPNWELSHFPEPWIGALDRFDEVWCPSGFIFDSINGHTRAITRHLPVACEVTLSSMLSRRYFGIPESAFAFLFFFDFRSFAARKNPDAVVNAFLQHCRALPAANSHLVVKTNGAEADPAAFERLQNTLSPLRGRVTFINKTISDNEIKNLVRCCDSFVSLHRSEGYGRGLAEAMYLAKPLICTGYSGNLDFMDAKSALLTDFSLIPVKDGEYPFAAGQVWADADVEQAARFMSELYLDRNRARELGKQASRTVRSRVSYRTVGMNYRKRIQESRDAMPDGAGVRACQSAPPAP